MPLTVSNTKDISIYTIIKTTRLSAVSVMAAVALAGGLVILTSWPVMVGVVSGHGQSARSRR